MTATPKGVTVSRGIFYFKTFEAARAYAETMALPTYPRIVPYLLGWAIQREKSGPYYGPGGWR